MKTLKILCLWLAAVMLLAGCAGSTVLDLSRVDSNPDRYVWGSRSDIDVSLGDVGAFYCKGGTLRYYDLDARQEYILCGRANCMHLSEECSAYFAPDMSGNSAEGVAQVGKYIYCVYDSSTQQNWADEKVEKSLMLIRVDPADGTRRILASFPHYLGATQNSEDFYAYSIHSEGYCGGWAWLQVGMQQPSKLEGESLNYAKLVGVNLETGKIVELNEYDGYDYSIECICPDAMYYSRSRWVEEMLSQEEFYELMEENGTVTIDGRTFTSYHETGGYWNWFLDNIPMEYQIFAYILETGETKLLFEGTTVTVTDSGQYQGVLYSIYGEYQGKTLVRQMLPNEKGVYDNRYRAAYSLVDVTDGTVELLMQLDSSSGLAIAQGSNGNLIFPDGKFFYLSNKNDEAETGEIWLYDFSTGENTFLFTDHRNVTFRIYGQWNGGYFGKHKDHQYQEGYYWISEEDFFAGNLDAMVHYDVGASETLWN